MDVGAYGRKGEVALAFTEAQAEVEGHSAEVAALIIVFHKLVPESVENIPG